MLASIVYWMGVGAAARLLLGPLPWTASNFIRLFFIVAVALLIFFWLRSFAPLPPPAVVMLFAAPSLALGLLGAEAMQDPKTAWQRLVALGAAGLFLGFAGLDFEHGLFKNLSTFTAGGVSFALLPPTDRESGDDSTTLANQEVFGGALPRTQAISYVTREIKLMAAQIEQDDLLAAYAARSSWTAANNFHTSPADAKFVDFAGKWLMPVGFAMFDLQDRRHTEFPALSAATGISRSLRAVYDDYVALQVEWEGGKPGGADPKKSKPIYPSAPKFKDHVSTLNSDLNQILCSLELDKNKFDDLAKDFPSERKKRFPRNSAIKFEYPPCSPKGGVTVLDAVGFSDLEELRTSNFLSYLALLTAFAESAEGNVESAIQLLDERIEKESAFLKTHEGWRTSEGAGAYGLARKQLLILRIKTVETTLVLFSSRPELLGALALARYRQAVDLADEVILKFDPDAKMRAALLAEPSSGDRNCLGETPWPHEPDRKFLFKLYYNKFLDENNAISTAARSPSTVAEYGRVDLAKLKTLQSYADDMDRLNVPCLAHVAETGFEWDSVSALLESAAAWRQLVASNFHLPPYKGDVKEACKALDELKRARTPPTSSRSDDASAFEQLIDASLKSNANTELARREFDLKEWVKRHYNASETTGCDLNRSQSTPPPTIFAAASPATSKTPAQIASQTQTRVRMTASVRPCKPTSERDRTSMRRRKGAEAGLWSFFSPAPALTQT